MNFWDRLRIGLAAFKGTAGMDLPAGGRSSEETLAGSMSSFLAGFSSINPVISFEMLQTLKCLWLYNPDFSQYIANIVNLGNPGHSLSIDAATDATAEAAVNRLNESASRLYPQGCGIDGLISQYLTSVAWSGAISSEDVVNLAARRVEKVVLVPVEQIRFRYNKDAGEYEPYQKTSGLLSQDKVNQFGLIKLNTETYQYLALSTVENSPYAKPPATAAVEPIIAGQKPIMDNIQWMAQKIGLLGMVAINVVEPPKLPTESVEEHKATVQAYMTAVARSLDGKMNKGLLVLGRDQKFQHEPVTTGAQGVYDLNRLSEEQVFSGMGTMPGFHGRTDSTTETFADVVYYLLTAQVGGMQRIVKRRQEQTYRLDLRLGGIEVDGVSLQFNKAHSRNALAEAQTDQAKLTAVIQKVEKGIISPDEGAQELGYETWFDESLLGSQESAGSLGSLGRMSNFKYRMSNARTIRLSFDKGAQQYRYLPDRYEIASDEWRVASGQTGETVVPFGVKKNGLRVVKA